MVLLGILLTLLGFLISFASLGITQGVGGRMLLVLIGIAVSFTGILAVINRALLKNAIWRK